MSGDQNTEAVGPSFLVNDILEVLGPNSEPMKYHPNIDSTEMAKGDSNVIEPTYVTKQDVDGNDAEACLDNMESRDKDQKVSRDIDFSTKIMATKFTDDIGRDIEDTECKDPCTVTTESSEMPDPNFVIEDSKKLAPAMKLKQAQRKCCTVMR
jgi:hypothetical protein